MEYGLGSPMSSIETGRGRGRGIKKGGHIECSSRQVHSTENGILIKNGMGPLNSKKDSGTTGREGTQTTGGIKRTQDGERNEKLTPPKRLNNAELLKELKEMEWKRRNICISMSRDSEHMRMKEALKKIEELT
ncbi:hypothetical protein PV327_007346 [Microctonus hyperodae]|uniref:Uncharacterized protein n=1 Tax=Microctonus hyperodae TaxID=165561 RepID=A0AA39FYZ2_MICHY|nr:hypothetical protein PV327_007346 [Microctonus hyperodae]